MKRRSRVADLLVYGLVQGFSALTRVLPEAISYRVADGLGRLYYRLDRRRRAYALFILRQAFPELDDRQRHRIASRASGNLGQIAVDAMLMPRYVRSGTFAERVDWTQVSDRAPKPPFLGLSVHLGSWEVSAAGFAAAVGPVHAVVQIPKNPWLARMIVRSRGEAGVSLLPRRGGIRALTKVLEAGGVGAQVVDQYQRKRAARAPLFGLETNCERAAAALAVRMGIPLLMGSAVRQGLGFHFVVEITGREHPDPGADPQSETQRLVEWITERTEDMARRHPEQYLWIHNRYHIKLGPGHSLEGARLPQPDARTRTEVP